MKPIQDKQKQVKLYYVLTITQDIKTGYEML